MTHPSSRSRSKWSSDEPDAKGNSAEHTPRLMILGGGPSQVPGILRAKELGFQVIVADANPLALGATIGDRFAQVSTLDVPGCIDAARAFKVDSIMTLGSDQPVLTAALVAQALHLENPLTPEQAMAVTNKVVMKQGFLRADIPTQPYRVLTDNPNTWNRVQDLPQPWVIKPADSQGQRGIKLLTSSDELIDQIPKSLLFSRCNELIVESYYPSKEVTLSGWARGPGQAPEIWCISDRITFDPQIWPQAGLGVCYAHGYPSQAARGYEGQLIEITHQICQQFKLEQVPLYFQFLIGDQGIRVNEIACRLGGAYEDQWIPRISTFDPLTTTLETYWPKPAQIKSRPTKPEYIRNPLPEYSHCYVPLVFASPGTVHRIEGIEQISQLPGVLACKPLLEPGTTIGPMENSTQRALYAILMGNSASELNRLIDYFFDHVRIMGTNPSGQEVNLLIDPRLDT
jgi:phosphoribosylaminoimidazole carboxylase (NCAIR synthetase)